MDKQRQIEFDRRFKAIEARIEEIGDLYQVAVACNESGFQEEARDYTHTCRMLQGSVDLDLDILLADFPDLDDEEEDEKLHYSDLDFIENEDMEIE